MSSQVPGKGKWQGRIQWLLSIPAIRWLVTWLKPLPSSVPGISDDEKAKLDYGHDMKLREVGLDKGCFAVVLAIIGATGIYCGNKKLDEIRQTQALKLEEFRTKEAGARAGLTHLNSRDSLQNL